VQLQKLMVLRWIPKALVSFLLFRQGVYGLEFPEYTKDVKIYEYVKEVLDSAGKPVDVQFHCKRLEDQSSCCCFKQNITRCELKKVKKYESKKFETYSGVVKFDIFYSKTEVALQKIYTTNRLPELSGKSIINLLKQLCQQKKYSITLQDDSNIKELYFYAKGKTFYQSLEFQYVNITDSCGKIEEQEKLMNDMIANFIFPANDFFQCVKNGLENDPNDTSGKTMDIILHDLKNNTITTPLQAFQFSGTFQKRTYNNSDKNYPMLKIILPEKLSECIYQEMQKQSSKWDKQIKCADFIRNKLNWNMETKKLNDQQLTTKVLQ